MSDTRAESLTNKLRKEFGNVPSWRVSSTQECLDAQYSHWLIRLMYCERANDYNRYGPIARTEYKMCKKDIGELSEISLDTIKGWIARDRLNGFEIKARYQQLFDEKQPNVRKAKKLLAELRRDEGDCRMVGELRVRGWIESGFDVEVIKQRAMMTRNRVSSATPQLTRVSLGAWSRSEYLFIQLHSELLLAVMYLPATPTHDINDPARYVEYCHYFSPIDPATKKKSAGEAYGVTAKGLQAFIDKRDELSGFVMWAIRQRNLAMINEDVPDFRHVEITPDMLEDYRQIRERFGFDTYLHEPKLLPELWTFLQDAAREQFPEFSGDPTQAGSTQDVDNNGDADVDMDSNPIVAPGPVNNTAATSDHGPADGDVVPGADADAGEEGDAEDAEDNTEDDEDDEDSGAGQPAAQPATRQSPDDFALETGTVRCTEWSKETNSRCKRHADNENEDRRTWRCHNHDPVRKAKIKADRLARNRAAKAGKNGKMANKAGVAKPKQKKAGKKAAK
ncbi:unnamed protein product [Alternaria alternata]